MVMVYAECACLVQDRLLREKTALIPIDGFIILSCAITKAQ